MEQTTYMPTSSYRLPSGLEIPTLQTSPITREFYTTATTKDVDHPNPFLTTSPKEVYGKPTFYSTNYLRKLLNRSLAKLPQAASSYRKLRSTFHATGSYTLTGTPTSPTPTGTNLPSDIGLRMSSPISPSPELLEPGWMKWRNEILELTGLEPVDWYSLDPVEREKLLWQEL